MINSRWSMMASLLLVAFLVLGSLSSAAEASETTHRLSAVDGACGVSTELDAANADDVCDAMLPSLRPDTWSVDIALSDVVERRWQDHTPDGRWSPS